MQAWKARKAASKHAKEFDDAINGVIPAVAWRRRWSALKEKLSAEKPGAGTRKMSEKALEVINAELQTTIGGSADLTPSNNTKTKNIDGDRRPAISPAAISITASASMAWRRR